MTRARLADLNPAYVFPALRKTLVQLLTELQFSGDSTHREEGAKLLGHLISAAPRLEPCVDRPAELLTARRPMTVV